MSLLSDKMQLGKCICEMMVLWLIPNLWVIGDSISTIDN